MAISASGVTLCDRPHYLPNSRRARSASEKATARARLWREEVFRSVYITYDESQSTECRQRVIQRASPGVRLGRRAVMELDDYCGTPRERMRIVHENIALRALNVVTWSYPA